MKRRIRDPREDKVRILSQRDISVSTQRRRAEETLAHSRARTIVTSADTRKGEKNITHTKSERNVEQARAVRDEDTPTDVRTRTAARVSTSFT